MIIFVLSEFMEGFFITNQNKNLHPLKDQEILGSSRQRMTQESSKKKMQHPTLKH